jgi:uncharacterized protein (TIGR02391 family)
MTTLAEIIPDPDTVLSLEPEELAGVALELLTSSGPNEPSRLNPVSFTGIQTIGDYPQNRRDEIEYALMESWQWLVQEGLIAPRPGDTHGWHFITRRGKKIKNREGLSAYRSSIIFPRKLLHPAIVQACWSAFLRGDNDTAVFQTFKELEVAIREAGNFKADDYGVDLARKAFNESNGPLTDQAMPVSERQSLSHIVAGALGSYKNPHSHRKVKLNAEDADEMIILGSHLLKIVDVRANKGPAPA